MRERGAPVSLQYGSPAAGSGAIQFNPTFGTQTSSVQPRAGFLVVLGQDGKEGARYPITDQIDIGRTEGDVIVAQDAYLSPRHARIINRNGLFYLRDLGSANGVFVRVSPNRNGSPPHGGVVALQSGSPLVHNSRPTIAAPAYGPNPPKPTEQKTACEVTLHDQDLFLVGQQVLRFEVVNDAADGLAPAMQHGTLLFGTPESPRFARLCQRTVAGVTRDVFYIRKQETVIGRESGDIVFAEDPFLSRRHAVIRVDRAQQQQQFTLADLGSSNGTFLQLRGAGEITLMDGDQFRIGQQLFRIDVTRDS